MIENYEKQRQKIIDKYHSNCIFNNHFKLNTKFNNDGSLNIDFFCKDMFQGYDDIMHGGILSAIFDAAMVQCLFGHNIIALTAKLNVRFKKSVDIKQKITVKTNIENIRKNKFYSMKAVMYQNDVIVTSAEAVFVKTEV